ncbi:MAG TPA: hypothetical protein VF506_00165 [Streptosporangiaceae bacterium]
MTAVDELAPYPKRAEEVTALGLARYYAVLAQQRLGRIGKPSNSVEREAIEVLGYVHEYALAALLRSFVAANTYCADRAAQAIWRAMDAGEMTGEQLWEWLTGWGIDPEQLREPDGAPVVASSESEVRSAEQADDSLPGM